MIDGINTPEPIMQITAAQLNQVAALIGTTDKSVVFSAVLKTLTDAGMALNQAFDALFGAGAYDVFAGSVYDALKAKA